MTCGNNLGKRCGRRSGLVIQNARGDSNSVKGLAPPLYILYTHRRKAGGIIWERGRCSYDKLGLTWEALLNLTHASKLFIVWNTRQQIFDPCIYGQRLIAKGKPRVTLVIARIDPSIFVVYTSILQYITKMLRLHCTSKTCAAVIH